MGTGESRRAPRVPIAGLFVLRDLRAGAIRMSTRKLDVLPQRAHVACILLRLTSRSRLVGNGRICANSAVFP